MSKNLRHAKKRKSKMDRLNMDVFNMKLGRRTKSKGDWSLPGYNYMGPGNTIDDHPPTSEGDKNAYIHDQSLQYEQDDGYTKWGKADQDFLDRNTMDYPGDWASQAYFTAKKAANYFGAIGTTDVSDEDEDRWTEQTMMGFHEGTSQFAAEPTMPDVEMSARAGATEGGVTTGVLTETPIDPFRNPQLNIFPETVNVTHPYTSGTLFSEVVARTSAATDDASMTFTLRLNTPIDVICAVGSNDLVGVIANPQDGSVDVPIGRVLYASMYKYYTTVFSHFEVTFWIETGTMEEFEIYTYMHGREFPPICDTANPKKLVSKQLRYMHRDCKHQGNLYGWSALDTSKVLYGRQKKVQIHYSNKMDLNDVSEDSQVETWTKSSDIPTLAEYCTFVIQRSTRSPHVREAGSGNTVIYYQVQAMYGVQYKDLGTTHTWPTTETSIQIANIYKPVLGTRPVAPDSVVNPNP